MDLSRIELNPFAIDHQVSITTAAVRRIRRGHLWIYAGEVEREPEGADPPIVRVADSAGNILGHAFYSRRSTIRLRLISRDPGPPSLELLRKRIGDAIARRRGKLETASACRLIYGEADLLPGIIVDRYGDCLVLQTLSSGADALKLQLTDILKDSIKPAGIVQRNDVKARRLEGMEEVRSILWGSVPDEIEIIEDGISFTVDLLRGQKTGFFLDQSENRVAAKRYVSGQALDCFTNTGAFALHFASRCESVLAVDISSDSLVLARRNAERNGIHNIEFVLRNVFDYLREMESEGRSFDTVCLDPPAFAKNRKALAGAQSGYKEINLRAMKLLKPGGILITSSCSYHMSEPDFFNMLCDAAHDSHRYLQVIERRGQASDHPVLASMPETYYLKCFFIRVL
jgi:23S rRNA (cytosine1962-C5)-methyltransferase